MGMELPSGPLPTILISQRDLRVLMGNPMAIGEAFQITSDESVTWNQIYQAVADALHVEYKPYYVSSASVDAAGPYDFEGALTGDKANTVVFDNKKLKNAVPGLCMNVRMEQGIRKTPGGLCSFPSGMPGGRSGI